MHGCSGCMRDFSVIYFGSDQDLFNGLLLLLLESRNTNLIMTLNVECPYELLWLLVCEMFCETIINDDEVEMN